MDKAASRPIQKNERAIILDVLRGFALFGVLLANVWTGFSGYGGKSWKAWNESPTWPADHLLNIVHYMLLDGKFYSLFSLLFGIGFSVIMFRNEQKGITSLGIFYRRLFILFLIGLAHALLVFSGDVLIMYAICGVALTLFHNCKDRTLLIWASGFIVLPVFLGLLYSALDWHSGEFFYETGNTISEGVGDSADKGRFDVYREGAGWTEWRNKMVSGYLYLLGFAMQESYFPRIFGMFLIGLYVGRKRIYANLEAHTGLFKKIFLWGSLIGLPACGAMAYTALTMKQYGPGEDLFSVHFYHTVFYAIGVAPLSLAYASALCLIWIKTKGNTLFRWLAPVGRMALTNYLVQSLAGVLFIMA